jgi:hypothetical protein
MTMSLQDTSEIRDAWIARLTQLIDHVEQWGRASGWATRRLDKKLEDPVIGEHSVPALLMQEGTTRIMLEPIGRSSPGTEGIVDLYLMPAYDDIATFYYYGGQWNLHRRPAGSSSAVANAGDAEGKPLSQDVLQRALADLRQHAA